ncbi:MAG: hydroxymethylglutaryl-CoA lyase [Rhodobacter sp.]|nr:hydroxymethylglutaryl-CoA lyase [Rhodobacter sp.]MCY4167417.1 hydroxymethylglutaryl-CoA lyase [Rhodobacter sp.]MCY4241838.1 hydroxymethylglutaryl-CoA lyase [Rhodobacter sp.]
MSESVEIFEVGPRDGLQNEPIMIPARSKIELVDRLSRAGFRRIEVASFVSPKWVPQMADGAEVLAGISRAAGVSYAALVPNMKGLERAFAAGADEIAVFGSASEGFSRANTNRSVARSMAEFRPVIAASLARGIPVRGYVSCAVGCPYDGPTPPERVADVAESLMEMGCYEVSLGDTIGRGTPGTVGAMLEAVLNRIPADRIAGHFHDTGGRALDNVEAALAMGIRRFDAAVGGLGGCPYAPGATGNVATESVAARLGELGFETGLDPRRLNESLAMVDMMRREHV